MRLILDVMGGDRAPLALLEGATLALPRLSPDVELVLVGDEKQVQALLSRRRLRPLAHALARAGAAARVRLVHAAEAIEMEDSIRAVRAKPRASINVGIELAAQAYRDRQRPAQRPAAFVSAGHSGAVLAAALLHMGRLQGVERPAVAIRLPTLSPDGCVLLDVGANVDCKPQHLRDFAIMGAVFAQVERKTAAPPRVGLLSNGEEASKGNELTRAARDLIEPLACFASSDADIPAIGSFIGNVEGKEIFRGRVDVVVTDGFIGNVVLKSLEGLGSAVVATLKRELKKHWLLTPLGLLLSAGTLARLKGKLDYAEYGAAPLLGVAGYAFICHGRSNPRAIKNALLRAAKSVEGRVVERMEEALGSVSPA